MKTITKNVNEFYCNPKYTIDRIGNYDKQESICEKWEFTKDHNNSLNGNLGYELTFDKNMKIVKRESISKEGTTGFYKSISSPLALYRLICMFQKMPTDKYNDWYKVVWSFPLTHKESGEMLSFREWKGAFGFWTKFTRLDKVPESFMNDLKEIIEFLISDEVAHPYDNLVAGSVA